MNKEAFDKGLQTRREVLGADYVDNAIKNADDFNMPMQDLVTEYCWNEIWNRPGLDRKTRSIINLAMLTALNRPHELKLHVRSTMVSPKKKSAKSSCKQRSIAAYRRRSIAFATRKKCSKKWESDNERNAARLDRARPDGPTNATQSARRRASGDGLRP